MRLDLVMNVARLRFCAGCLCLYMGVGGVRDARTEGQVG